MRRRTRWTAIACFGGAVAGGLGAVPNGAAAQQACKADDGRPLDAFAIRVDTAVRLVAGTTALALTDTLGAEFTDAERKLSAQISGDVWTPSANDILVLSTAQKRGITNPPEAARLKLSFGAGGRPPCLVAYTTPLDLTGSVKPTPLPTVARVNERDSVPVDVGCRMAGDSAERALKKSRGRHEDADPIVILFQELGATSTDGRPCFVTRRPARQGDALHVGVYTITGHTSATTWTGVRFDPCAEEEMYPVYASPIEGKSGQQAFADYSPLMFAPRHCFSSRPTITVTGEHTEQGSATTNGARGKVATDGDNSAAPSKTTVTQTYILEQAKLYVATVQAGVLSNALQSPSFGLQPNATADTQRVYNKGPVNGGPVYVATVVLYGFLNHIASIGGPRYRGRDPVHDNGFMDRIGLVLGAGFPKPGENFFGGASFEVVGGVNVLGGWQVTRMTELAGGVKEGDVFKGTADQIPTHTAWRHGFKWGVSLDLRFLGRLLPSTT